MKKIVKIIVIFISLLSLCGCDVTNYELKNRLIIQALGIDSTENGVEITVQALNTSISSNPNSGIAVEEIVRIFKVEGQSISSAIRKLSESSGMIPMLAQNRIIVFGKELAQNGIGDYIDYFIRNPQNRATVLMAVADGKASDVVSAKMGSAVIPAKEIQQMLESSKYNSSVVTKALYQFINDIESETTSAHLPVLRVVDTEKEEEKKIEVSGAALFDDYKYTHDLDKNDIRTILLVTDDVKSGSMNIVVPEKNSTFSLSIIKCTSDTELSLNGDEIQYNINVKCSLNCLEKDDSSIDMMTEDTIKFVEQNTKKKMEEDIIKSIDKCLKEYSADPYYFGRILWRKEPKFFKTLNGDWKSEMEKVKFNVNVDVMINKFGNEALKINIDNKL